MFRAGFFRFRTGLVALSLLMKRARPTSDTLFPFVLSSGPDCVGRGGRKIVRLMQLSLTHDQIAFRERGEKFLLHMQRLSGGECTIKGDDNGDWGSCYVLSTFPGSAISVPLNRRPTVIVLFARFWPPLVEPEAATARQYAVQQESLWFRFSLSSSHSPQR